jgi:hypothetical protein
VQKEKIVQWHVKVNLTITLNEKNMKYLIARCFQPSAWAGISLMIHAWNVIQSQGLNQVTIGMAITAAVAIFMPSKQLVDKPYDDYQPRFPQAPKKSIDS